MRKFLGGTALAVILAMSFHAEAQEAAKQKPDDIAIDKVILSTAGLADFEYRAKVDGNAELSFPVRLEQVDDILKSLVVFDAKGRIGGVTLPGKQPLAQIFRDLPFTQGALTDPTQLLNAYQGASVTAKGPEGSFSGILVRVTTETSVNKDGLSETRHRVSLMTAEGLRQFVLEDLQSLAFDDEKVRGEIDRALKAVRENSTAGQRNLQLSLKGEGAREVMMSYVVEAPLWKSAYRMVLPEKGDEKGLMQGWAVIENQTASDWKSIDLTLVSGNPVTFRQALYQSYYVERPDIPVQVFGRVMPKMDDGVIGNAVPVPIEVGNSNTLNPPRAGGGSAEPLTAWRREAETRRLAQEQKVSSEVLDKTFAMDSAAAPPMPALMMESAVASSMATIAGGANAAASAEATSQVLFRFPDRFDLKAGQSMMLPFVSHDIPMTKLDVYQYDTNDKHPLAAVELTNDSESSLPPGVLTLYEESELVKGTAFIGDAQLPALGAGEKRLVPYALDSKTNISRSDKVESKEGKFVVSQGVLRVSVVQRHETTYQIAAPEKEDRLLVIEAPKEEGYKIVTPDPKDVELTDTQYRIRVPLKAGEKKTQALVTEQTLWNSYGLFDMGTDQLLAFAHRDNALDAKTRKAFEELAGLRREMDGIDQQIQTLDSERQTIFEDQNRVRENLQSLQGKSEIQQKYMDKLSAQEDRVAEIDARTKDLRQQRQDKEAELQKAANAIQME